MQVDKPYKIQGKEKVLEISRMFVVTGVTAQLFTTVQNYLKIAFWLEKESIKPGECI